jgi:hypothetical protein
MPLPRLTGGPVEELSTGLLTIVRTRMTDLCQYGFNLLYFQVNKGHLEVLGDHLGFSETDFKDILEFCEMSVVRKDTWGKKLGCTIAKHTNNKRLWFKFQFETETTAAN